MVIGIHGALTVSQSIELSGRLFLLSSQQLFFFFWHKEISQMDPKINQKTIIFISHHWSRGSHRTQTDSVATGLIPVLGRSPGGGHGNPLQYSCLENPCEQRSLGGYNPQGNTEQDTTEAAQHARMTYSKARREKISSFSQLSLWHFWRKINNLRQTSA